MECFPVGRACWFPNVGRSVPFALALAHRCAVLRLRLAAAFLASAALVLLGLYVRLKITETPVFQAALDRAESVGFPLLMVARNHFGALVAGHWCAPQLRHLFI